MSERRTPDAVRIPDAWKGNGNALVQAHTLVDHAETILGVDRTRGERAWVRDAMGGQTRFCTKSPEDTMLYPLRHPQEGRERYNWVAQTDGSAHGFLIDPPVVETDHASL